MTAPLLVARDGAIATLTMNRPETRNALTDEDMIDALESALVELNADTSVRVAILTGNGPAFSSGGNLKKMNEPGGLSKLPPVGVRTGYRHGIQRLPMIFQRIDLPVIAAVNGPAIGAGCDLTCMCDLRIAGEAATFAESFVKVGLIPGDGGAWLLPRVVGFSKACEMALTGETIDAREALNIGLVSKVVADADLLAEARKLAERIAVNPPHAVRMTKRLLREAQVATLPAILELSSALQALAHHTGDHREAVNAFVERRKPDFKGD